MISQIRGRLLERNAQDVVIDCNGLGYEVLVPMTTLFQLPAVGAEVTLLTHFVVREDAQQLYGFIDRATRALFRDLIKVNGVGPKLALTVLSGVDVQEFARLVLSGDSAALVKLPGVGKKTAERLVIEMRDKLKNYDVGVISGPGVVASVDNASEAEAALIALGYKPQEAARAIARVDGAEDMTVEDLIRGSLKNMISGK